MTVGDLIALLIGETLSLFFLLILLFTRPAVLRLLVASLLHKPVLILVHPDHSASLTTAAKYGTVLSTKNPGHKYIITPGSAYHLRGAGTTISIAYSNVGCAVPVDAAAFAAGARENDIQDINEFKRRGLREVVWPTERTIRIQDIEKFFNAHLNPEYLATAWAHMSAAALAKAQKRMQNMVLFMVIILVLVLMLVFFFGGGGHAPAPRLPSAGVGG